MAKRFNTTGVCIPRKHFMVDIINKLNEIEKLIEDEFYFVINRPRQYGKTTTLVQLYQRLKHKYTLIDISFESLGKENFEDGKIFCKTLINLFRKQLKSHKNLLDLLIDVDNISDLGDVIINLTQKSEIILIIDEVDKASNNRLLLDFLGMLRALYIDREKGACTTFKSVILAGVHDVKQTAKIYDFDLVAYANDKCHLCSLDKLKFRDNEETRYNSPWNIAVSFDVDMSFNEAEIGTMIREYSKEHNLSMDVIELSKEIYKFTSGYPFLVSRICQVVDENITGKEKRSWVLQDIQRAVKNIIGEKNTLFDDLIKNMENNTGLYECIYNILVSNISQTFNIYNPAIDLGHMFGYLVKDKENNVAVSNQILKEVIYNYMISKTDTQTMAKYNFKGNFITTDNGLDMDKILLRFQQFMKENYSSRDTEFLERQGVLLFLSFIKPIINGVGFDYKEVQISEERRLDIVIQYNSFKYVIETKIWHGEAAHERGLKQLREYLNIEGLRKGYLLIFNFNKNKEYTNSQCNVDDKEIFQVMV